ncbi:MAG: M48 family metallopeptidase [Phycisphaerales bacterium]
MVNFELAQRRARRSTRAMVVMYTLGVTVMSVMTLPLVIIVSTVLFGAALFFTKHGGPERSAGFFSATWRAGTWIVATPDGRVVAAAGIAAATGVMLLASLSRWLALREGGRAVAEGMGARQLDPSTTDEDERRVLNVVEEMAVASAIPVPPVYVMRGSRGVNAWAAGYSASDAVIGVTEGCIRRLTRDQLQGVVAHEFGHIRSGDMRLNIRLVGMLHGVVVVGDTGRSLLELSSGDEDRDGNLLWIPGLAMLIVGGIGTWIGSAIRAAINRGREFLADACAVEFTRYPDGLTGALRIVGGQSSGGRVPSATAREIGHMLFASGFDTWASGLLATHPPLDERVRRLDRAWDGSWLPGREWAEPPPRSFRAAHLVPRPRGAAIAAGAVLATPVALPIADVSVFADAVAPAVVLAQLDAARSLLDALDPVLLTAARDAGDARILVCAMLMDARPEVAAGQRAAIADRLGADVSELAQRWHTVLGRASPGSRLPLLEIAVGSLSALSREQYQVLRALVEALVRADQRVSLFEWCLERSVLTHLDRRHGLGQPTVIQYYSLKRLKSECSVLLSTAAHAGKTDEAKAASAVAVASRTLGLEGLPLLARGEVTPERLGAALATLAQSHTRVRRQLVLACAQVVGVDGRVTPAEAELLRAIADGLDTPLAMPLSASAS